MELREKTTDGTREGAHMGIEMGKVIRGLGECRNQIGWSVAQQQKEEWQEEKQG